MTPKEKAYDLMIKFFKLSYCIDARERHYNSKECALIAVDEILNEYKRNEPLSTHENYRFKYWQEVKQEIEKL